MDLSGLVTIDSVVIDQQNVVGARLPVAREVKFNAANYSMLAKPFWIGDLSQAVATYIRPAERRSGVEGRA